MLEHVPEINVYMEYEDKTCLDDVLQLYRSCNVKVLNIQITRAAENEEHNACAIFTLRLPRSCTVNRLMTLVGKRKRHRVRSRNCKTEQIYCISSFQATPHNETRGDLRAGFAC